MQYETGIWHNWGGGLECPFEAEDYEFVKTLCIDRSPDFWHGRDPDVSPGTSVRLWKEGLHKALWCGGSGVEVVAFYLGKKKPPAEEMTVAQIEELLGRRIKIIGEESTRPEKGLTDDKSV